MTNFVRGFLASALYYACFILFVVTLTISKCQWNSHVRFKKSWISTYLNKQYRLTLE